MADDYIITVTYKLDPGNVASEAAAAGKQSGKAFTDGFKSQVDLSQIQGLKAEGLGVGAAKQSAKAFQDIWAKQDLNLADKIEKAFGAINFSRGDFGKNLEKTIHEAIHRPMGEIVPPPAPKMPVEEVSLVKTFQPLLSGLESVSMLLRGAPITSVAQMMGQTVRDFAAVGAGRGARQLLGGRVGETGTEAIERRLAAIPPVAGPLGTIAAGEQAAESGGVLGRLALSVGAGAITGRRAGTPGVVAGAAIGAGAVGIYEVSKAVADLALKAAEADIRWHDMAETMGMSMQEFTGLQFDFAKKGVNVEQFSNAISRLALSAKRDMPAIAREVAASDDKAEEANIRVRESERGVEKARDDRKEAGLRVAKAEAEVAKFEATGAQMREQRARAADLGVSGAQIGLRGAQMRATQAGINLQFAPQEAALADIRGPLTVEGAKLGRRGAQIAAEEARARYRRFQTGEEEDPDEVERRNARKERLQLDTAEHNLKQSKLREDEAQLAEEKRQRQKGAGVGPEEQAQQQAAEAAQAEKMAQLTLDRAETTRTREQIDQRIITAEMEYEAALRARSEALRGPAAAEDAEKRAAAAERQAKVEKELEPLTNIKSIQKAIQDTIAGKPAGLELTQVPPEEMRRTLEFMGGGKVGGPGGTLDILSQLLQSMKAQGKGFDDQQTIVRDMFAGRGMQGEQLRQLTSALAQPMGQRTPEEQALVDRIAREREQGFKPGERTVEEAGASRFRTEAEQARTGRAAEPLGTEARAYIEEFNKTIEGAKQDLLGLSTSLVEIARKIGSIDIGGAIKSAGDGIVGALNYVAGAIRGAAPEAKPAETEQPKLKKRSEIEAVEQTAQSGGLLHGLGTATSDSIPIMASAGEYVVKASQVAKLGVPFLDALNAGRVGMQEGGSVDSEDETRPRAGETRQEYEARTGTRQFAGTMAPGTDTTQRAGEAIADYYARTGITPTPFAGETTKEYAERTGDTRQLKDPTPRAGETTTEYRARLGLPPERKPPATAAPTPAPAKPPTAAPTKQKLKFKSWEELEAYEARTGLMAGVDFPMPAIGRQQGGVIGTLLKLKHLSEVGTKSAAPSPPSWTSAVPFPLDQIAEFLQHQAETGNPIRSQLRELLDIPDPNEPAPWKEGGAWHPEEPPPFEEAQGGLIKAQTGGLAEQLQSAAQGVAAGSSGASFSQQLRALTASPITVQRFPVSAGAASLPFPLLPGQSMSEAMGEYQNIMREAYSLLPILSGSFSGQTDASGVTSKLIQGFANGGLVGGFTNAVANISGYANGGKVASPATGNNTLSFHQLDLRTNAGNFTAGVSDDTMEGLRNSSLRGKLSQTGQRPSWYS